MFYLVTAGAGPVLTPGASCEKHDKGTILVATSHAKYKISRPSSLRDEEF